MGAGMWDRSRSRIPLLSFLSTSQTIQKDKIQFLWIPLTNSLLTLLKSVQFCSSHRNLHSASNPQISATQTHKYSQYPIIPQSSFNTCLPSSSPNHLSKLHIICRRFCLLQKVPKPNNCPQSYLLSAVICSSVSPPLSSWMMYSFSFSSPGFMRKLFRKMSGEKGFLGYLEGNARGKENHRSISSTLSRFLKERRKTPTKQKKKHPKM